MIEFRENAKAGIDTSYNPDEKQQKARRMVYQRYTDMRNGRYVRGRPLEDLWEKWERQYEADRPDKNDDDWQSNIVPPFTTAIVERALSEIVGQTLRPKVVARGREDKPKAKLMNYIFDYTWECGDGDLQLRDALKSLLVLGKCIWQEDYYIDKREVKVLKKFDPEQKIEEYETKYVFDYNDVYGENVSLRDFYIDPAAKTINRGRYKAKDVIRRYIMDYDVFMETFEDSIWDQFGATKYVKPDSKSDYFRYYDPPKGIRASEVEVLFYWGRVPDKLIIVANDVVIRDGPNPYNHKQLPFAEGSDVTRLDGFWARGEPELLESIQDELTTLRRMRIDRQHLDIFKTLLVSNREIIDEDDSIVRPSHMLPVDDPANVKALEYADINPSAYQEENLLKQDGREVTGVQNPQPSGTATEAAIFKESTMKTLQMKVWGLSRELMMGIAALRVSNVVQYWSAPNAEKEGYADVISQYNTAYDPATRMISTTDVALEVGKDGELIEKTGVKGENFFEVTPEMITPKYGKYKFKLVGDPTFQLSKPLQQQKVAEFMANPVIQAAVQTQYYDINKLADKLTEVNDFDPEDFKADNGSGGGPVNAIDPAQLMELANRENKAMLEGKAIGGTTMATIEHTQIHLAFMSSPAFVEAVNKNPDVAKNFVKHILEEEAARKMRGEGSPQGELGAGQQGMPPTEARSIMAGATKAGNPSKVVGSEMLPTGINGKTF